MNATRLQPSIFPGYKPAAGQFMLASSPSGAAGARVKLTLSLNNSPQILDGVRSRVSYELPAEFWRDNPGFKRDMREGGVDTDFLMSIDLTQQNITQDATHVDTIQGAGGVNYHPFPSPYLFQGGNNVTVTAERLSSYPVVVVGQSEFIIAPTLHVTLVLNSYVAGRAPTPVRVAQ